MPEQCCRAGRRRWWGAQYKEVNMGARQPVVVMTFTRELPADNEEWAQASEALLKLRNEAGAPVREAGNSNIRKRRHKDEASEESTRDGCGSWLRAGYACTRATKRPNPRVAHFAESDLGENTWEVPY